MSDRLFAVVGDGNITGTHLNNVGNRTFNYNTFIHPPERQFSALGSRVSYEALLNSEARYPAPKCHPATRKAAQKVVKNWLCRMGEGSEKGIMWMSAALELEKQPLLKLEELCGDDESSSWLSTTANRDRYIDGCFFFGRGFENREKASFFPATIAFQLRRSRTSCRSAIDQAIERRPEIFSEALPSQFRCLLMQVAQTTSSLQGPITVVIDGLDECNSVSDQVTLLELILGAVKAGTMRFFIASRPEEHIYAFFHRPDVSQHTRHVRLDEETFKTSQDIKAFLREEFSRIRQSNSESCRPLRNGEEWPGERVLDHLTIESDSQFMFPILAIGFIDTPFFPPDKQLQILLESPPSRAFSALDTLYHRILSRQPPTQLVQGEDDLREYQEVVMGILRVVIAWSGKPLSAAQIAVVLDKHVDVVQRVVRGPMRSLFKFHTSQPDSPITLCHKSLRDYLLDGKRAQEFFIPSAKEDDLFITVLSLHSTSHSIVMDVLSFISVIGRRKHLTSMTCSMRDIGSFLGVDATIIKHVVDKGPTNMLFDVQQDGVDLCTRSFSTFLRDPDRSGPFFLSNRKMDTLLTRSLSRQSLSKSPHPCSRDNLLDILAVVIATPPFLMTTSQVAAFLEADCRLVEHMVTVGPTKWLVMMDKHGSVGPTNDWVNDFLTNGNRSGEFFVSRRRLDPIFIRLLSQQWPSIPSHPSSRDAVMGILTAIRALMGKPAVCDIASVLGINLTLVEDVVKFGPTSPLFIVDQDRVGLAGSWLARFLWDSDRSGPFFVSSSRMDLLYTQILSRQFSPDNQSSDLYSRDVLLDILAATLDPTRRYSLDYVTIRQIATFLNIDPSLVEHVAKLGAAKMMFIVMSDLAMVNGFTLENFLMDADRSGEFFISDRRLDPFFVRILSKEPTRDPLYSETSSHDMMLRVLAAVLAFDRNLTVDGIASVVGVDALFAEGVVLVGPTKVLFSVEESKVKILWASLKSFLQDSIRSGTFFVTQSSIDALFIRTISNGTTSARNAHHHSQDLLMDVLTVMLTVKHHSGSTLRRIAAFLDVDPSLIEGIVSGPSKELFRVEAGEVTLSSPLLGPFLRDVDRAGDFCITNSRMDALYAGFFSRQVAPDYPRLHTKDILASVLSVMAHTQEGSEWTVSLLATFLDADLTSVERVVHTSPSALLFKASKSNTIQDYGISIHPSLGCFLKDASRAGESFVSDRSLDSFFTRILSSAPPSGLHSNIQDILKDVLAISLVTQERSLTVPAVAAALDVNSDLVECGVKDGPARSLFDTEWVLDCFKIATTSLRPFLCDPGRSGEFYISDAMIDALFIRILSRPPPPHFSHPYLKDVLLGVMAVIQTSPVPLTMPKIAARLSLDRSIVEGVIKIMPAKVLFWTNWHTKEVNFSGPFLKPFLQDVDRSGEFFIPPTTTLDDIPKPWVRLPTNTPEVSYLDLDGSSEEKEHDGVKGKVKEAKDSDVPCQESEDLTLGIPPQSPVQGPPGLVRPKRKLSRLAASRQNSSESANEVAGGSSATATKRPRTSESLALDPGESQDLYELDSDAEEVMITEAMLVDDEDIWDAESLGDCGVQMVKDSSSSISVEQNEI